MSLKILPFLLVALIPVPAAAGPAYTPPSYAGGRVLEPPPALLETAAALHRAAMERHVDVVLAALSPRMALVSGAIDIAYPRSREDVAAADVTDWLARLAMNTGGDWDLPPDQTAEQRLAFLHRMELDFVRYSLEETTAWGADPLVPGAICSYVQPTFDRQAVVAAGALLSAEGTSFRAMRRAVPARATPEAGAAAVATLEPGLLYAVDYGQEFANGWTPFHLPAGGTGWIEDRGDVTIQPLAQGLCFAESDGRWLVVAQTAIGL